MIVTEILTYRGAFKNGGTCILRKDQGGSGLLKPVVLTRTVEDVLIVGDGYDHRFRVTGEDALRQRMVHDLLFHIDMRERKVK